MATEFDKYISDWRYDGTDYKIDFDFFLRLVKWPSKSAKIWFSVQSYIQSEMYLSNSVDKIKTYGHYHQIVKINTTFSFISPSTYCVYCAHFCTFLGELLPTQLQSRHEIWVMLFLTWPHQSIDGTGISWFKGFSSFKVFQNNIIRLTNHFLIRSNKFFAKRILYHLYSFVPLMFPFSIS